MTGIFLYGTLCYPRLLSLISGAETPPDFQKAALPDHAVNWAKGGAYPVIYPKQNALAEGGLVKNINATTRARLDYYEAMFGYQLRRVLVLIDGVETSAEAYFPLETPPMGGVWSLADWVRDHWPQTRHSAAEIMDYFDTLPAGEVAKRNTMIQTRAASHARAAANPAPATMRSDFGAAQVHEHARSRPYAGFFTLEESTLAFRRFDGKMSDPVGRTGFVGGDAAILLPYDPKTDHVLVIEQFRYGPYLRGDPRPWVLEPIAGRVDGGESPQTCARREAYEEAGLTITALEHIADYYPSPGAVTEFFYSYIGLTDLTPAMAGIGGLQDEAEDIRSHVIAFEQLMELVSSGEAGCGPLVLCALWLQANRPRLRAAA